MAQNQNVSNSCEASEEEPCIFCERLSTKNEACEMINRALYYKYPSSQNFNYSKCIEQFLKNAKMLHIINFKDQVCFENDDEFHTELFKKAEIEKKLAFFREYYKYHGEIPRLFGKETYEVTNRYHDEKRKIEYYRVKQLIKNQKKANANERINLTQEKDESQYQQSQQINNKQNLNSSLAEIIVVNDNEIEPILVEDKKLPINLAQSQKEKGKNSNGKNKNIPIPKLKLNQNFSSSKQNPLSYKPMLDATELKSLHDSVQQFDNSKSLLNNKKHYLVKPHSKKDDYKIIANQSGASSVNSILQLLRQFSVNSFAQQGDDSNNNALISQSQQSNLQEAYLKSFIDMNQKDNMQFFEDSKFLKDQSKGNKYFSTLDISTLNSKKNQPIKHKQINNNNVIVTKKIENPEIIIQQPQIKMIQQNAQQISNSKNQHILTFEEFTKLKKQNEQKDQQQQKLQEIMTVSDKNNNDMVQCAVNLIKDNNGDRITNNSTKLPMESNQRMTTENSFDNISNSIIKSNMHAHTEQLKHDKQKHINIIGIDDKESNPIEHIIGQFKKINVNHSPPNQQMNLIKSHINLDHGKNREEQMKLKQQKSQQQQFYQQQSYSADRNYVVAQQQQRNRPLTHNKQSMIEHIQLQRLQNAMHKSQQNFSTLENQNQHSQQFQQSQNSMKKHRSHLSQSQFDQFKLNTVLSPSQNNFQNQNRENNLIGSKKFDMFMKRKINTQFMVEHLLQNQYQTASRQQKSIDNLQSSQARLSTEPTSYVSQKKSQSYSKITQAKQTISIPILSQQPQVQQMQKFIQCHYQHQHQGQIQDQNMQMQNMLKNTYSSGNFSTKRQIGLTAYQKEGNLTTTLQHNRNHQSASKIKVQNDKSIQVGHTSAGRVYSVKDKIVKKLFNDSKTKNSTSIQQYSKVANITHETCENFNNVNLICKGLVTSPNLERSKQMQQQYQQQSQQSPKNSTQKESNVQLQQHTRHQSDLIIPSKNSLKCNQIKRPINTTQFLEKAKLLSQRQFLLSQFKKKIQEHNFSERLQKTVSLKYLNKEKIANEQQSQLNINLQKIKNRVPANAGHRRLMTENSSQFENHTNQKQFIQKCLQFYSPNNKSLVAKILLNK